MEKKSLFLIYIFKILTKMPAEKGKIKIKSGKKRRIPVPQKPPKVIPGKNSYDRKKEKDKAAKKGFTEE